MSKPSAIINPTECKFNLSHNLKKKPIFHKRVWQYAHAPMPSLEKPYK